MIVRKVDFYCGAFLSYLITNKVEPTLFEAGDKSKILRFTIGKNDYKAFLKYSTKPNVSTKADKISTRWDTIFTEKDLRFLRTYSEENRQNIVVIVCTDGKMKNTFFAVIDYTDAQLCLGDDSVNKERRISITHLKGSDKINVYGTAISDKNAFQTVFNCDSCFGVGGEEK